MGRYMNGRRRFDPERHNTLDGPSRPKDYDAQLAVERITMAELLLNLQYSQNPQDVQRAGRHISRYVRDLIDGYRAESEEHFRKLKGFK